MQLILKNFFNNTGTKGKKEDYRRDVHKGNECHIYMDCLNV